MTGFDLDKEMRAVLLAARPETVLSSTAKLVELGFPARASFDLVAAAIKNNPELVAITTRPIPQGASS